MFASTSRIEIAFRILMIVAMLLSAPLNSFSVQAANETATPTSRHGQLSLSLVHTANSSN